MAKDPLHSLLISDFCIDNLGRLLDDDPHSPPTTTVVAPYGQVLPLLMNPESEFLSPEPDCVVIWTRPESQIKSFAEALHYGDTSLESALQQVDEYAAAIEQVSGRAKFVFVPAWVTAPYRHGWGLLDLKPGMGIENTLLRMNLRLAEQLSTASNVFVLNAQKWIQRAGPNACDPRMWYMAKVPFTDDVFKEAALDLKAALCGLYGGARKLILLDLDDTLWGGIVGEAGWQNVRIGGHDAIGEAFQEFQSALQAFTGRGILLGIISKNEEDTALEAIENHPEMVLRKADFAGWKINWKDKAQNIVELVSELNLGLDAVVFIDDNPVERARVSDALPDVLVPDWPKNKLFYTRTLLSMRCFDSPALTGEDRERSSMYVTERQRKDSRQAFSSLDEWLCTLETRVQIELLNDANLQRASQLLNKTNQMNLTTRRMSPEELRDWAASDGHRLWTLRVSDRFGDAGLTGIVSVCADGQSLKVVDFVLSCRVFGRGIEEVMLHTAIHHAQTTSATDINLEYRPSPRNKPCHEFLKKSGLTPGDGDHFFSWNAANNYSLPKSIKVIGNPF